MLLWVHVVIDVEVGCHGYGKDVVLCLYECCAHSCGGCAVFYLDDDFADVHGLHSADGWSVGSEDAVAEGLSEGVCHLVCEVLQELVVAMAKIDVDDAVERGIMEELAFLHLLLVHGWVVVADDVVDDGCVCRARLQYDFADSVLPSCSSCHLCEGLEAALVAAEVGDVEHGVGIEDSHYAHVVEVQAFRHHLRANEDVALEMGESIDDFLVGGTCLGGVEVHAAHSCLGEVLLDLFFDFLCPCANAAEVLVTAFGTVGRKGIDFSAVVATEVVHLLVVGEAHVAMLAARHPSALLALDEAGEASSVLEKDYLLLVLECLVYCFEQAGGEGSFHALLESEPLDVDDFYLWQLHVGEALGEWYVAVASLLCEVVGFDAGGGCAEEGFGSALLRQHDGGAACVVAWRWVLLLVGGFVFFVHDDESEPLEGEEDGGAHAEDEVEGVVCQLLLIDFGSFLVGEFAVIDSQAVAKGSSESLGDLCGECDFGQEVEHLFALANVLLDEVDVDFCLS